MEREPLACRRFLFLCSLPAWRGAGLAAEGIRWYNSNRKNLAGGGWTMGNDFIKAYEKLRPVLRDLYLYGCFGRGDFPQRQISARKYDNEKRKIVHFLPQ